MKTNLLLASFVFLLTTYSYSQSAPTIQWQNDIGGFDGDYLGIGSVQQTSDGGYIIGGWSDSDSTGDKTEDSNGDDDYWIIKTDSTGNIQWQNSIGGTGPDRLNSLQQTRDGGYILAGTSGSNISGDKTENTWNNSDDYWIVKTDAAGNILWQNTIGGNQSDYLQSIEETNDGGYILGGYSNSDTSGDKTEYCLNYSADYWIVKTDSVGIVQWDNTIGGYSNDDLFSVHQTSDGGYILGGVSGSNISADKSENCVGQADFWIVKTDAVGNIQWQNTIGGDNIEGLYSIQQTNDGGYIFGGRSDSNISGDKSEDSNGSSDYWLVKTDASGNIQWQNTIGGSDADVLYSIRQTTDGGYILGGGSISNISGDKTENTNGSSDNWAVKTDSLGNVQWDKTIGGSSGDGITCIQETSDGGYILAGSTSSNISGDKTENCYGGPDYWIIKLGPDNTTGIVDLEWEVEDLIGYPNPVSETLSVIGYTLSGTTANEISIYNVLGEKVLNRSVLFSNGGQQYEVDVSLLQSGIYFLEISLQPGIGRIRFVKK